MTRLAWLLAIAQRAPWRNMHQPSSAHLATAVRRNQRGSDRRPPTARQHSWHPRRYPQRSMYGRQSWISLRLPMPIAQRHSWRHLYYPLGNVTRRRRRQLPAAHTDPNGALRQASRQSHRKPHSIKIPRHLECSALHDTQSHPRQMRSSRKKSTRTARGEAASRPVSGCCRCLALLQKARLEPKALSSQAHRCLGRGIIHHRLHA